MKHFLTMAAVIAAALSFNACDSASSLARDLTGAWSGTPERLFDADASSGTMIETFSFAAGDTIDNGGQFTVSALMSVTGALSGAEGITVPVSVTASGYAMITGTWQAISADRVKLLLDESSLMVKVDPDAVVINADMFTGTSAPANMATLKPQLAESIAAQLRHAVSGRYRPEMTMTGVSVKDGTTLRFKIDKSSYTFSRQPD